MPSDESLIMPAAVFTTGASADEVAPWPTAAVGWTAAVLLTLAMFMSYVDRSILALLIEPIKVSLHCSDIQIGLLQGLTFGLVFTVTMVPCGWLVDNVNRTKLLCGAIAIWSIMTAACGLAATFTQMFAARMGVAIGEATLGPSAPSLIADYFPPGRRTPPLSLYSLGAGAGVATSLLIGGAIARVVGGGSRVSVPGLGTFQTWQIIFFVLALPGLLLSLLFFFHQEPRRRGRGEAEGTLLELMAILKSRRLILLPHMIGYCLYNIFSFSVLSWLPAYFMRVHGWSIAEVGIRLGAVQLLSGAMGTFVGGQLARGLWHRGRRDANLLTAALCLSVMVVPAVMATMAKSAAASLFLSGLTYLCLLAPSGPLLGAIQDVIPGPLRGRVTALYYVVLGFVGMTLGPLVIGAINEYVFVGPRGIGKSLALTAAATLPLAAALLVLAGYQRKKVQWTG